MLPALDCRGFFFGGRYLCHLRDEAAVFCKNIYRQDPNSRVPTIYTADSRVQKRQIYYARPVYTYLTYNMYWNVHPINAELIAVTNIILLIYKHHIIVNHKMDQLQESGEMEKDFWREPVSAPQSSDYGDWGALTGTLQKSFLVPPGSCNCHIWGTWLFFVNRVPDSGLQVAYWGSRLRVFPSQTRP